MDHSKPLPAIPKSTFSTLTVDAARHRSRLVRHFLAEIREEQIEKRKDGWAAAIEEALDELGLCFANQDWLRQLKQAQASHKAKQRERQAEGSPETKEEVGPKEGEKETQAGVQMKEKSDEEKSTPSEGSPKALTPNESPRQTESVGSVRRELLLCASLVEKKKRPGANEDRRSTTPAIGCHFKMGHFDGPSNQQRSVLFGSKDPSEKSGGSSRLIIGGTFVFEGINTDAQFEVLSNSLKLAVYVQLSLILEHHLLCDSCVPLTFPRPKLPSPPSVPIPKLSADPQSTEALKPRKQSSLFPSGLLSFFSRNALPRSRTVTSGIQQRSSSDLGMLAGYHLPLPALSRPSLDIGTSGFRRFSIIGESPRSPTAAADQPAEKPPTPYLHTFNQIQGSRFLLSSSPGIDIAPPTLLCQLAHVEERKHGIRLKGDQKTALSSMLGWDGKEHLGNNMSGIAGFLRHQSISVLVTRAVPCGESSSSSSSSQPTSPEASSDSGPGALGDEPLKSPMISAVSSVKQSGLLMCGQPKWRSYRYYSMENGGDSTLGEALEELVSTVNDPCDVPDCKQKRGQHQLRIAHNKVCITVTIEPKSNWDVSDVEQEMETWQSCAVCGAETKHVHVSDGTLMYSCGKYFEMLIYSPLLCSIKPTLCEHTKPPPLPWPNLPFTRFNIVRHFLVKTHVVSFATALIDDLHDLKVPRLQVIRGQNGKNSSDSSHTSLSHCGPGSEDDKKQLRREMRIWWEGVYDHIDNLENLLASTGASSTPKLKALPRLPSEDADFHEAATPVATQRWGHGVPPPSPATASKASSIFPADPVTPSKTTSIIDYFHNTPTAAPYAPPPTPSKTADHTVSEKLSNLRFTFQRMEQSLYAQLGRTSVSALNDIRRSFQAVAQGAEKRVLAWQKKNITMEGPVPEYKAEVDPWWWTEECHAAPGSSVIVREDDWSSLIAYTLSTTDYLIELANMSLARLGSVTTPDFPTPHSSTSTKESSLFSAALGYKLFNVANQSQPQADPDVDGAVWNEPEMFTATVSRFSQTRDTSSIFKDVMRQKSVDVSTLASRSLAGGASRTSTMAPPPMAYAKPDIGVSRNGADGEVTIKQKKDEGKETVDKLLSELEFISTAKTQSTAGLYNSPASSTASSSKFSKPPSIASTDSQSTIGKSTETSKTSPDTPPLSPRDAPNTERDSEGSRSAPSATASTIANTLSTGISSAMRFVRRDNSASRPMSPGSKIHRGHGLLVAESANGIEDRPHIKYEWTIGKRMKFSCIVYYARQFDNLRRRCGIDDSYIQSLATSSTWLAEGGKSKARFRKTNDERFIIKTLVDAWNVADLQVLLELAPSYFQYIESTASKATSLAKMVGFYTLEIRNVETGVVHSQADLLVMENLFYGHQITKVFDLKGISGRKVKPKRRDSSSSNAPKTLFDGEWIEGQTKALVVVKPHSRHVLRCALRNDADFLSRSNIMDYSLLVGVEESTKEIVCGIVDTIGSYTVAKTLEYKAKQNLSSGKETTVMPPAEYQERFINALEGYFVACPDKWSKPEDSARLTHHINELPCVL